MSGEDSESSEGQSGPPDEHLRETLERELGEVPPESPSEPPDETDPAEDERNEREQDEQRRRCE